ncbi:hypothetical protein, variant [Cladophialophora immunda]|uniref:Uncharacterized protein n=1 Tax=Cladophialophora immunda TaxID=569365 RepID=A0A0D2B7X5_9EURO|nr:hypothetical protein, variant [Cladophialophora immunda]KIW33727.1 hypothetical protein, variant [Cladophialophora immunda]
MEGAEAQPSKEKKGLKTVWNRIKDLFREKPAAAQDPLSATTPPSVSAAPVAPQTEEAVDTTKPGPPIEHSPEQPADETAEEPEQPSEPVSTSPQEPVDPKQDSTAESHMRFTKAQAIFARHNLELDETEWEPRYRVPQERVYKNIRMRVRYTCHNCSTTFGRDRICMGCQHRRCTRCSRYPPKKDRTKHSQDPTTTGSPELITDVPRPSAEGGTCHECQSGFEIDAEECPNCHHRICERCLHEATISVEPSHETTQEATQEAPEVEQSEQRKPTLQESSAVS